MRVTRREAMASMLAAGILAGQRTAHGATDGAGRTAVETDICIYGGTSAGVMAAVQARRLGRGVLLVEPGRHLGGLTSGGLGATDSGRRESIGGLSRDFYRRVREHYVATYGEESAQVKACSDGFRFEPHVAERIFEQYLESAAAPVRKEQRLVDVELQDGRITALRTDGLRITARLFIDCTYEGDLMAAAGVSYTVGRESNEQYGETINGVHYGHRNHNFKEPIDPYVTPGDPASGLLPTISHAPLAPNGTADECVQAYCYRMCLTKAADRLPFPKPAGYDPDRYALLARYLEAGVFDVLRLSTPMPNGKTDTNNYGGFSTDNIGLNYDYPDGDRATRERIIADHITYQQGLMYFLGHDEQVPQEIRDQVNAWGLPADEFQDTGGWPHQLYIREARRMVSDAVLTEHHCRHHEQFQDSIGLASYGMDSHNCQRLVVDGVVRNEGNAEYGVAGPYPIAYRAIVPRTGECPNLLVPVCLSATHIAYGSARMEPVFMSLGQAAATAASQALETGEAVQDIDVARLQVKLRIDGQIIGWFGGDVAPPPKLDGIVVDDAQGEKQGPWIASTIPTARLVGTGYLHDGNAAKGEVSITYRPAIEKAGKYRIVLASPPNPNRARNVPVKVRLGEVELWSGTVDQRRTDGRGLAVLCTVDLPAGAALAVTVSNAGTDGYVVADGLQVAAAE